VNEPASPRLDRAITVSVATALFAIYAAGACRTIYVGDSGELVTAVHVLGIPHPSGYPLYVLLGKLWTILVPVGSIAFRMSLFSAACAATACALLFATVRQDGGSRTAGLFGAGILAFGPSFWHEANIQRVYALNALFVVLALNRALAWHRERKPRDLVVTMLICGLGATNHTVMALVGVAVAVWAPIVDRSLFRRPRIIAVCAATFLAGLLPYAYLPIRSRMDPVLNWGEPSTLERLLDVVLRRTFWHRAWWESPRDVVPVAVDFLASLGPETAFAGAALALLVLIARPDRKWVLPLLVIALNVGIVARHGSYYDIFVWHRYYIPSYLSIAFLAAAGLDTIAWNRSRLPVGLAILIPATMLLNGWNDNDRSKHRFAEDFARLVLDTIPPGAKLLTVDDNVLFAILYMKHVERLRPDVELIPLGVEQRRVDLVFNPDVDALFLTHPMTLPIDGLEFAPRGVVIQAVRSELAWPEPLDTPSLPGVDDPDIPKDLLTRALIAHDSFMRALTAEYRDWGAAVRAMETATRTSPDWAITHYNLGLIWARNGFYDEAIRAFERADTINPRGIEGRRDPRTRVAPPLLPSDKIAELRKEKARIEALERRLSVSIPRETEPGSAAWHRELGSRLAAAGEPAAARAHFLRDIPIDR
jgi:hypothetical protein